MKRYIKTCTLSEILADPRGRELVDRIEEAEDEIRGREIDPEDTSEFWVNARNQDIDALQQEFGYVWR